MAASLKTVGQRMRLGSGKLITSNRRGQRLVVLVLVLGNLSGCGWVSSKFDNLMPGGLFSRFRHADPLPAGPDGQMQATGPAPQTASTQMVERAEMPTPSTGEPAVPPAMTPPTVPVLPAANVATMTDAELRLRVAAIDQQMQLVRTDLNNVRPSIDRLVRMEGDIRQLVQRLTQLSSASGPAAATPPKDANRAKSPDRSLEKPMKAPTVPARPLSNDVPVATGDVDPLFADTAQFAIHLASYRSELRAAQGWRDYQQHFQPLINALQPRVQGIDFNDGRGLFFRLKGGPFETRADAQKLCDAIHERGEFCKVEEFSGTPLAQATAAK